MSRVYLEKYGDISKLVKTFQTNISLYIRQRRDYAIITVRSFVTCHHSISLHSTLSLSLPRLPYFLLSSPPGPLSFSPLPSHK